jgi:ABC-type amino acid transport substrate-binding protein
MTIFRTIAAFLFIASSAYAEDCKMIAGASDYSPLTYNGEGNIVEGMDVKLLNLIAKQTNCTITWQPIMPWENVVSKIKSGEITFATSATKTPERQTYANFIPYRPDSIKIFVRKEDLAKLRNITSFEDIIAKTTFNIGIYQDYHYGPSFEKAFANPKNKSRFSSVPDTLMTDNFVKLIYSQVDAVILETVVGLDLIKRNNWTDKITTLDFEMNDQGPNSVTNIMISKAADPDNKFYYILQNAVASAKDSPEYKKVLDQYTPSK